MAKPKLDKIDNKIIKRLQENGKMTNLQLSEEIGLSPAPTLERVRKLENSGIITGYHANVDSVLLGMGIKAYIQLSLERQAENSLSIFVDRVQRIEEIVECHMVTGTCDFILKAVIKDIPAFENLITNKLGKIDEIRNMQTMVILSQIKQGAVTPADN
jgi:Lrp/AsnC family leucine-responsive transcriptional regulator